MNLEEIFCDILDDTKSMLSDIKPSAWAEKHRTMSSGESQYVGKFSYDLTPYCREIVDCIAPDHPARIISVIKGAQIGFSTGVIEPGIGYTISENPGNILLLTGHSDLSEEAMEKIDLMIDSCGIRYMIQPTALRKRANKTGDTNLKKQFSGGSLIAGPAGNHKLLRQRSIAVAMIDDYEAAKGSTKDSGSTTDMIKQRLAAYYSRMKLFFISTPEVKSSSNIEPLFLEGDQRRYHIPCPCCGTLIVIHWAINIKGSDKEMAGMTWKLNEKGELIDESVGYICQECGDFFNDHNKLELIQRGKWIPTATPKEPNHYSYHISALLAPPGMYDWIYYVRMFLAINTAPEEKKEAKRQTFKNLVLGETYEPAGDSPKANQLQKNIRAYEIGTIPQKLSTNDGNGEIIMLTCACDLNGKEDDARLDYEVLAWAESGASYSIDQGSIGTFIPMESKMKIKVDRERWTYEYTKPQNVWKEFDKVLKKDYFTDNATPRRMKILLTGVDTGHYENHAFTFVDKTNHWVIGLKGKNVEKTNRTESDLRTFAQSKQRSKFYLLEVNKIKDQLHACMNLKWDESYDDEQPVGFMNFPSPGNMKYLFKTYFEHFESEHRVPETTKDGKTIGSRWQKKGSDKQNHFWDVRVYNMALKDIITHIVCTEAKIKNYTWQDYVNMVLGRPL